MLRPGKCLDALTRQSNAIAAPSRQPERSLQQASPAQLLHPINTQHDQRAHRDRLVLAPLRLAELARHPLPLPLMSMILNRLHVAH